MDNIYYFVLFALMALAVLDLVVGVSNDAVNFLNSAIGSRVASRRVILAVASVGILIGAISSNGMMEIARSGVFMPAQFGFHEIMMIFLAVMITDVVLLDMFNTFGLPTSTTVSLVFELLGAAVIVALYKIKTSAGDAGVLADYINSGKAMAIISGILVSVVVAFVCGTVIMFFSRLLFSFRYKKTFRILGPVWCGLALTAIAYFTLFKGMKGTTLISKDAMAWLSGNVGVILIALLAGFTVLMAFLQHICKVNILKIIVLTGTCALALAFAGNDLVNFIGVSMGGLSSFEIAQEHIASGGDLSTLTMGGLAAPITTNWLFLLAAGIVMTLALWFSKKARTVTETEVNLARQGDGGVERFGSSAVSRGMVRSVVNFNRRLTRVMPSPVTRFIDKRFKPSAEEEENKAPFDLIRASVNLTISALLISLATSLKLPLSTTYVTFMVAMGSSLSDRAWGRESAVYRITGVLAVISGWFMTALIAFTVAAVIGLLLMVGKTVAIFGLIALCVALIIQSSILHKKRAKKQEASEKLASEEISIIEKCSADVYRVFEQVSRIYTDTLNSTAVEDRKQLRNLYYEAKELYDKEKERKLYEVLPTLNKLHDDAVDTGHYYVQVLDYLYEVSKSLMHITKVCFDYIDNNHTGLSENQVADLKRVNDAVSEVNHGIIAMLKTSDFTDFERLLAKRDSLFDLFVEIIKKQIKRVKKKECTTRNSILYLDIINETKTMVLQSRNLMKSQKLFVDNQGGGIPA